MSKKILVASIYTLLSATTFAQSISPIETSEQCPGTNITFTVTLPSTGYTFITVVATAITLAPTVVQQPSTPCSAKSSTS